MIKARRSKEMRFFLLIFILTSCRSIPHGSFLSQEEDGSPDYSNMDFWAATPMTEDEADRTPGNVFEDMQADAPADVFFIHPTTYTDKKRGERDWNASLSDIDINNKTDEGAIRFQASVFNGAAKVYAPRYRQAHIYAYFAEEDEEQIYGKKALAFAYEDVKASFIHYLDNWNKDRPIIIASHSQGTTHAIRLINEFFEGKPLMEKMVAAYLVGMPVRASTFPTLQPCEDSDDTACYASWRSYQRGFLPKWHESGSDIVVTNPLSWKTDSSFVSAEENEGTVLYNFDKGIKPGIADAQVYEDHLWVNKPKFRGSIFLTFKNYHIADYNLFYANIRKNAQERVEVYLESEKQ